MDIFFVFRLTSRRRFVKIYQVFLESDPASKLRRTNRLTALEG